MANYSFIRWVQMFFQLSEVTARQEKRGKIERGRERQGKEQQDARGEEEKKKKKKMPRLQCVSIK